MLSSIKNRFISLLQLILVITYIIFEELIWEGIAKPIYKVIHSLKILQKVEVKLHAVDGAVILFIFVFLLAIVEALGIYAGILFVSGQVMAGLLLYLSKIPIAAFTFWVFRVTEDKLMKFGWFAWLYNLIMKVIDWFKSLEIHQKMMERLHLLKAKIKEQVKTIKEKYFSEKSQFITKIKHLYKTVKESLSK